MIQNGLLQLQAYDHIKEMILNNTLQPDVLYSETKLSSALGLSRTPVREALKRLSQDGYITTVPSKGFMIRRLTEKDMLESIQVRCAIEGYCTYYIIPRLATPKGQKFLAKLEETLNHMKETMYEDDNYQSFLSYDHGFHLLIVNFVGNEEFSQLFQRLMYLIHLTSVTSLSQEGRLEGTYQEHAAYLQALKDGDGQAAYTILIDHLMKPLETSGKK